MGLDIRIPIGAMFVLLGPILLVTGLVDGTPLNVQSGAAMLVFRALMLVFGARMHRRRQ